MRLTKKAQYALLLVTDLLTHGRTRVCDSSERLGVSSHFLEQIARLLRVAGIIESVRGPGGGYQTAAPNISMLQVIEAVETEDLITVEDFQELMDKGPAGQAVGTALGRLSHELRNSMQSESLVEVRFPPYLPDIKAAA